MAAIVSTILTGGVLTGISKVIDSIRGKSPEDAARLQEAALTLDSMNAKYNAEFSLAQLQADTQANQMQAYVNRVEAASASLFVSGWRPYIGWVCGTGLLYQFLVQPLLTWTAALFGKTIVPPTLDLGTLVILLLGMLGQGGYRTYEKIKGVA